MQGNLLHEKVYKFIQDYSLDGTSLSKSNAVTDLGIFSITFGK